jgi:DNA-binding transcriptional regulator YdaS (Cro superfamily)
LLSSECDSLLLVVNICLGREMSVEALQKAIQIISQGNQAEFARKLSAHVGSDVKQQTVSLWIRKRRGCSPGYAIPIEELTRREVTREQLRPDRFGASNQEKSEQAA